MFSCPLDARRMSGVWQPFGFFDRSGRARRSVAGFPGGDRRGVTPVPMPNTAVKPSTADGTAGATPWESRSLPGLLVRPNVNYSRSAFFYRLSNAQNREDVTLVFNDLVLPSEVLTHQGREFNIQLLIYLVPVQVVIWLL